MFKQAKKLLIPYNTRADAIAIAIAIASSPAEHILAVHSAACHIFGAGKKLIETHARMKPDRAVSAKSSGLCGMGNTREIYDEYYGTLWKNKLSEFSAFYRTQKIRYFK